MKTNLRSLFILLTLFAGLHQAIAQDARFFRISGPASATITALQVDGTLVWSNAEPGATYTIQTATSLTGETNWVDYVQLPVTDHINTNRLIDFNPPAGMALIPAGSFNMGNLIINGNSITNDPDITDATPTNVYVSAFYMDVSLVSYSLWESVRNWATNNGYGFNAGKGKAVNHPVVDVDWYDAVKWCNARSQQAGLTPMYYTDAGLTQIYTSGQVTNPYVNWSGNGYRLPTEAEWEKAARGGLIGQRFPWGNFISENLANYYGTNNLSYDFGPNGYNVAFTNGVMPYTSPVGYFAPNGYGLCDVAGNVDEWCWDWFEPPPYPAGSAFLGGSDPTGPASGSNRCLRGGYWSYPANRARLFSRNWANPNLIYFTDGFRCARRL